MHAFTVRLTSDARLIFAVGLTSLLLVTLLSSCENIDLANSPHSTGSSSTADSNTDSDVIPFPIATGMGTMECPYAIEQLLSHADTHRPLSNTHSNTLSAALEGSDVWVIGYAVGEAYRSMGNATFTSPFTHGSNILLASDSLCSDATLCIPIELSTTKLKSAIALSNNDTLYHQCLLIRGTLQTYLSIIGLRNVTTYRWFPHHRIPDAIDAWWEEGKHRY